MYWEECKEEEEEEGQNVSERSVQESRGISMWLSAPRSISRIVVARSVRRLVFGRSHTEGVRWPDLESPLKKRVRCEPVAFSRSRSHIDTPRQELFYKHSCMKKWRREEKEEGDKSLTARENGRTNTKTKTV